MNVVKLHYIYWLPPKQWFLTAAKFYYLIWFLGGEEFMNLGNTVKDVLFMLHNAQIRVRIADFTWGHIPLNTDVEAVWCGVPRGEQGCAQNLGTGTLNCDLFFLPGLHYSLVLRSESDRTCVLLKIGSQKSQNCWMHSSKNSHINSGPSLVSVYGVMP